MPVVLLSLMHVSQSGEDDRSHTGMSSQQVVDNAHKVAGVEFLSWTTKHHHLGLTAHRSRVIAVRWGCTMGLFEACDIIYPFEADASTPPFTCNFSAQLRLGFPYHSSNYYILDRKKPSMAKTLQGGIQLRKFRQS